MSLLVDSQATFATPTLSSLSFHPVTSVPGENHGPQDQQVNSNTMVVFVASEVTSETLNASSTSSILLQTPSDSIVSESSSSAPAAYENLAVSSHNLGAGNTKLFCLVSSLFAASFAVGLL